jgi:hypothetical protein
MRGLTMSKYQGPPVDARFLRLVLSVLLGDLEDGRVKVDTGLQLGDYALVHEDGPDTPDGHPTINLAVLSKYPELEAEFRITIGRLR